MPYPEIEQGPDRSGADVDGGRARRELGGQLLDRHRQKLSQRRQRRRLGAAIEEHTEDRWQRQIPPSRFVQERVDRPNLMVRRDLRQIEMCVGVAVEQIVHLLGRRRNRVGPSAKLELGMAAANVLAQLPRMLDAAWPADVRVTAQHDDRRKAMMFGLVGIAQAELQRMFAGEEWDDAGAGGFRAEIGDEVAKVVFFL